MKIYHYSKLTNEYLNESDAKPNPLEDGEFLIPANATDTQPPATGENEIVVFENGDWVKKKDYRNKTYYNKTTNEEVKYTEIDQQPDSNVTDKVPTDQFDKWDGSKWVVDLTKVKSSQVDMIKDNALSLLNETDWKAIRHRDQIDGSQSTTLTSQQYQTLLTERNAIRTKSDGYETQINAASTKTAAQAIVWKD